MNRRDIVKSAALALGYSLTGPAVLAVLKGCKAQPEIAFTPQFLSADQAAAVSELCEIIIPKTDTPGAKEAGVPAFIDLLLKQVYSPEQQQHFIAGLGDVDALALRTHDEQFADCTPQQRYDLVKSLHDEALASIGGPGVEGWWNAGGSAEKPFIVELKELTVLGYFTSEPGATQVLQYNPVPGPYQGCMPLDQVGKAWAT